MRVRLGLRVRVYAGGKSSILEKHRTILAALNQRCPTPFSIRLGSGLGLVSSYLVFGS